MERAIIGRGKYELRPQYQAFHVPESKLFIMTVSQREVHLKKFANTALSDAISPGDSLCDGNGKCHGRDLTVASSLAVDVKVVDESAFKLP